MTDLTGLIEEGQEVRVFDVNAHLLGQPEGGWEGTVTKVSRKLFVVTYLGQPQGQIFRLDSGRANDRYGHQRVQTLEQVAEAERRLKALGTLRSAGLVHDRHWGQTQISTGLLEALAAVIETWGQEATQ